MKRKRCRCTMFCRNEPVIKLDFLNAEGGFKTTRICIERAQLAINDMARKLKENPKTPL